LLVASALAPLAATGSTEYAMLAAALAIVVGIVYFAARLVRLGWIADYFSQAVLVGYITGVAVVLILGQLGKLVASPATRTVRSVRPSTSCAISGTPTGPPSSSPRPACSCSSSWGESANASREHSSSWSLDHWCPRRRIVGQQAGSATGVRSHHSRCWTPGQVERVLVLLRLRNAPLAERARVARAAGTGDGVHRRVVPGRAIVRRGPADRINAVPHQARGQRRRHGFLVVDRDPLGQVLGTVGVLPRRWTPPTSKRQSHSRRRHAGSSTETALAIRRRLRRIESHERGA